MKKFLLFLIGGVFLCISANAQNEKQPCPSDAKEPSSVALYDFVPNEEAQKFVNIFNVGKIEQSFKEGIRSNPDLAFIDLQTPINSSDSGLENAKLNTELQPAPKETGAKYYIFGKILKESSSREILLHIEMRVVDTDEEIEHTNIPFKEGETEAKEAGRKAAYILLLALKNRNQRNTGVGGQKFSAINPILTVAIDKERVKPNEKANVKVTLTGCDGKPLDVRKVFTRITSADEPPTVYEKDFTTSQLGSFTDSISANKNAVLSYLAMYEYVDPNGNKGVVLDSKPLIVGDGVLGMWMMNINFTFRSYSRSDKADEILGAQIGSMRYSSTGFLTVFFKPEMYADGSISASTNEYKSFSGFVSHADYGKNNYKDCGVHWSDYSATLDNSLEGKESFAAFFEYYPREKLFKASVGSLQVKGSEKQFRGCPAELHTDDKIFNVAPYVLEGIECQADSTGMMQSGKFQCRADKKKDFTSTEGKTQSSGFAVTKVDATVQPLNPASLKITRK